MTEVIDVLLRCASMILLAVVTYVVIPAIKDYRATKLDESQRQQLTFWVETGVLWAKQWMKQESNEAKKEAVTQYVCDKVQELGLPYSKEDIDKSIEAIYNTVKDITDAAAGVPVAEIGGEANDVA